MQYESVKLLLREKLSTHFEHGYKITKMIVNYIDYGICNLNENYFFFIFIDKIESENFCLLM